MATLLFLVLHAMKSLHSDFDSYMLCLTVGLDVVGMADWVRNWWYRRDRRR